MLDVKNLQVRVGDQEILHGINLSVKAGEVHAIMGPNGSGKSTFARALAGHPGYEVTGGTVSYQGHALLDMDPDERAREGVLEPTLAVLDETDPGLDIDALRVVADGVNAMRSPDRAFIVVTHYQRLLEYIVPDYVHVLADGRIVRSGGRELALELEEKGYAWTEPALRQGSGQAGARQ